MKNKCLLLVKKRLGAQLGFSVIWQSKDKRKRNSRLALIISLIVLFLVLSGYSGGYAYGLCYLGIGRLVPVFAFFICSVISFLLTVAKTPGELFGYRDFDFLMSIPVKTSTVIASRFFNLYLWNSLLSLLVMLPMGTVYAVCEKPGLMFVPIWIVGIFITCFVPTTAAVIIGALVTAVSSKFKRSGIVGGILMVLFTCIIMLIPFSLTGGKFTMADGSLNKAYLTDLLTDAGGTLHRIYPPAKLFADSVVDGNLLAFFELIAISIGWYLLFVWALSRFYKKINTWVSTYHTASHFELRSLNQGNAMSALYKKEIRRWIGSSVYFTNTIMGVVLAVLSSGALMVVGANKIAEILKAPAFVDIAIIIGAYVTSAWISMACTTASSISLEGKNVWMLQSMPVSIRTIFDSKLLVNLTLTIPASVLTSTLLVVALKPGVMGALVDFLIPIAFSVFAAVFGLWINLKMPNYNWESDTQVVKQSLSSLIGIMLGMLLAAVFAFLAVMLPVDYRLFGLFVVMILFIAAWFFYESILKKYTKLPERN